MTTSEELFLKEKQDYLDAVEAYRRILARDAQTLSDPFGMNSWYAPEAQGYERAATDPWIVERFPDLARAGQKVVAEEAEYMALDEPRASHAQDNCSIASYTAGKFLEYAALAEMLYRLATDEEFRKLVAEKLGDAAQEVGSALGDFIMMFGSPSPEAVSAEAFNDSGNVAAANDGIRAAAQAAQRRTGQRLYDFFSERWRIFKEEWEKCGLGSAVAKTGIDGLFLAGELLVGGVALRGIRFAYRFARGRHVVDVVSVERGTLATSSWDTEALEAKYGTPPENHIGGELPDPNRPLPDKSAEEMLAERPANGDPSAYRHPREGQPPRSNEELAPGGRVPSIRDGEFARWWNDLSPAELEQLTRDRRLRKSIGDRIRNGGSEHEWLKVSQQLEHKRLGFSMEEIQDWVTSTRAAEGPLPQPNAQGLTRWRHSSESGSGSGPGSVTMHNALDSLYGPPPARSRDELLRRMGYFANHYLDNGIDSLPPGLRNAILQAGGG